MTADQFDLLDIEHNKVVECGASHTTRYGYTIGGDYKTDNGRGHMYPVIEWGEILRTCCKAPNHKGTHADTLGFEWEGGRDETLEVYPPRRAQFRYLPAGIRERLT